MEKRPEFSSMSLGEWSKSENTGQARVRPEFQTHIQQPEEQGGGSQAQRKEGFKLLKGGEDVTDMEEQSPPLGRICCPFRLSLSS